MKAADWRTLNKIGLGICILLVLFSVIIMLLGYFLVGMRGYMEFSVAGFAYFTEIQGVQVFRKPK